MKRHKISYGDDPDQFGHLYVPDQPNGRLAVLVHGGYWSQDYTLVVYSAVSRDLAHHGFTVWNVEYRRTPQVHWPTPGDDVCAAIERVDTIDERTWDYPAGVLLGHSAGGQLALWAAAQLGGHTATVRFDTVIVQAAALDLSERIEKASTLRLFDTATDIPGTCAAASPMNLPPLREAEVVAIHGDADTMVPIADSQRYATQLQQRGQRTQFIAVPGAVHEDFIDIRSRAHQQTLGLLTTSGTTMTSTA